MMDWREKRALAYQFKEFTDVNLDVAYNSLKGDELAAQVISFFKSGSQLIYPAKSYFVALVYASLLYELCGYGIVKDEMYSTEGINLDIREETNFRNILNQPDLLPDDKYFVPYNKDMYTYDVVLERFSEFNLPRTIIWCMPHAYPTVQYFLEEFLAEDDLRSFLIACAEDAARTWGEEIDSFSR